VSFSISGMTALDAALPEKALRDQLKLAEHNWIQTFDSTRDLLALWDGRASKEEITQFMKRSPQFSAFVKEIEVRSLVVFSRVRTILQFFYAHACRLVFR
jgi:hypothetical protein